MAAPKRRSASPPAGSMAHLLRGVCPTCHTQDGIQALVRSAGYLGEFSLPVDCHDPFHRALASSMMKP